VSAVAWRSAALRENASVAIGDLVRTGDNIHPQFHVIALTDDRAWIRDTQHGADHIVPIHRCRRI